MIKFFRSIRQRLFSENKFSKYLFYAFGEIVLVVIGILIALSINNWNEMRKDQNSEYAILKDLKNEFQGNLTEIDDHIESENNITNNCYHITKLIRSNQLENDSHLLDSLIYSTMQFGDFDPIRGVIDDLLNSGKLRLISNDSLRVRLTGWTALLKNAEEDDKFRFENYNLNLIPFISRHFPLANGEQYKDLINTFTGEPLPKFQESSQFKADFSNMNLMEFENVIWHHKHNTDYVISENFKLKKEILSILKIVDSELESK